MDREKFAFIEALLRYEVLRFGAFTTKSGRSSPYFLNMGNVNSGEAIKDVAQLYARLLARQFPGSSVFYLYGPAYKGIPLAVAVASALTTLTSRPVFFTFNRKETKDHGEQGGLVGYQYEGGEPVVIVEDVLTGGTSIRESLPILSKVGVKPQAVVVGVDRGERGRTAKSARQEIEEDFHLPVFSLVTIYEILEVLEGQKVLGRSWLTEPLAGQIAAYLGQYGTPTAARYTPV